jgi:hypothetical protein
MLFLTVLLGGAVGGALGVNFITAKQATAVVPSTVTVADLSCDKGGETILITVDDNATTPNYYAVQGTTTTTEPCGTLLYGGPTNAGGATGTNASQVVIDAINSMPCSSEEGVGIIQFEAGTYQFYNTIPLPKTCSHSELEIIGQGMQQTILNFNPPTVTAPFFWLPYSGLTASSTFLTVTFPSHFYVSISEIQFS